jgi:hypothetical protein
MLHNSAADIRHMHPQRPSGRRGKTPLMALGRVDRRTRSARRAAALRKMWCEVLGPDINPHLRMLIEHAACAVTLAEAAQGRMLSGDTTITPEQVVKLSNIAQRAIRALNLPNGHEREAERGDVLPTRVIRRAK